MVAMMANVQRYCAPIFIIGALTGLLALIPKIGWLLGLSVFVLAWRYMRRTHFVTDLLVMLALWMLVRAATLQLFIAS